MFSRTFAAEMAPYNIRVLSYIPGVISTPMAIDWLNETDQIRNIPSYRYGQPEDLANALVFVSSDRASYINGVHIDVTGGKFCVQNPATPLSTWTNPNKGAHHHHGTENRIYRCNRLRPLLYGGPEKSCLTRAAA